MQFEIIYTAPIEVYKDGKAFLTAQMKNLLKTHLSFYKDDKLILKSSLSHFFIWRWIKITYQDLPYPIEVFEREGTFRFCMIYNNNLIRTIQHPLKKEGFTFYLNDVEVARVLHSSKIQFGYTTYTMITDTEDEVTNLYLLFAFLIQLVPT